MDTSNIKQTHLNAGGREDQHRRIKREREMTLVIEAIRHSLPQPDLAQEHNSLEVLEFGAGSGFQISFLRKLGRVTASDIVLDPALKSVPGVKVVECSIAETSFEDECFDLIFSNHVIEHLENPLGAFEELRRIGKPNCVYAFSVPTNLWLLLSVPAQYWSRLRRLRPRAGGAGKAAAMSTAEVVHSVKRPYWERFLPRGHGVEENFSRCYHQFKISTWKSFFLRHHFEIIAVKPLLLYGPSECPVIPTMSAVGSLCSSVLFILRQAKQGVNL